MKKIIMGFMVVVMGLNLSGCADPKIDDSQIKRYKSTKKDVQRILGAPKMKSSHNGKDTWTYTKSSASINKKGAGIVGAGYLASMIIPGASLLISGAQTAAIMSDTDNARPMAGKSVSASYTFNKKGVLISIRKTSFGT